VAKLLELKGLLDPQRPAVVADVDVRNFLLPPTHNQLISQTWNPIKLLLTFGSIKKAWHSPPNAFNIYQPPGKKFFLGHGLNRRSNLKGRHVELQSINDALESFQNEDQTSVAISGIGGIG